MFLFHLQKYGLETFIRTSPSFTPMLEKGLNDNLPRSLLFSNNPSITHQELSKFSAKDAKVCNQTYGQVICLDFYAFTKVYCL